MRSISIGQMLLGRSMDLQLIPLYHLMNSQLYISQRFIFHPFIINLFQKYKLRRIAEIKLFEFLVSLKYYQRDYQRARVFSHLCNISKFPKYQNEFSPSEGQDIYLQYYFLFVFKNIMNQKKYIKNQAHGLSLFKKDKIQDLAKKILIFHKPERIQSFMVKIHKIKFQKNIPKDRVDVDRLIYMLLDEYYGKRKQLQGIILKALTKSNAKNSGVYSIDDMQNMIGNDILNRKSSIESYSYPSKFTLARTLLHAQTSGQNKFTLHNKYFMASCTQFGLDSPFPFVFTRSPFAIDGKDVPSSSQVSQAIAKIQSPKLPVKKETTKQSRKNSTSKKSDKKEKKQSTAKKSKKEKEGKKEEKKPEEPKNEVQNIAINKSSALFAQHFSILRELRNYCQQFKEAVKKKDNDTDTVYKNFDNIINILDTGCQFLNFPVHA